MPSKPRPSVVHIICSVLVIAVSVVIAASAVAALVRIADPCSMISGAILLPFPVFVGYSQYRGTFHGVAKAAESAGACLLGIAALMTIGFFLTTGEVLTDGESLLPYWPLLLIMLVIAAFSAVAALTNHRFARALKARGDATAHFRISLREMFGIVALIAVTSAIASYFIRSEPERYGEHVSLDAAPSGLPDGATDICFSRGHRGTIAYEFTVDEDEFRQWVDSGIGSFEANAANVPLVPIDKPVSVSRYGLWSAEPGDPEQVLVSRGLQYSWSKEDRSVTAVYDAATKRAYYYASFH